jgi:hypothetical protein
MRISPVALALVLSVGLSAVVDGHKLHFALGPNVKLGPYMGPMLVPQIVDDDFSMWTDVVITTAEQDDRTFKASTVIAKRGIWLTQSVPCQDNGRSAVGERSRPCFPGAESAIPWRRESRGSSLVRRQMSIHPAMNAVPIFVNHSRSS